MALQPAPPPAPPPAPVLAPEADDGDDTSDDDDFQDAEDGGGDSGIVDPTEWIIHDLDSGREMSIFDAEVNAALTAERDPRTGRRYTSLKQARAAPVPVRVRSHNTTSGSELLHQVTAQHSTAAPTPRRTSRAAPHR
jgi:hypothetical protein